MKWNMALNMMDMIEVVYNRLGDVKFPFLVMHDPEDGERPDLGFAETSFTHSRSLRGPWVVCRVCRLFSLNVEWCVKLSVRVLCRMRPLTL